MDQELAGTVLVFILSFSLLGFGIWVFNLFVKIMKIRKKCTLKIDATCVDKEVDYQGDNHALIFPIWEINYNGETKMLKDTYGLHAAQVFRNKYEKNRKEKIRINPNNPNELYDSIYRNNSIIFFLFGLTFIFGWIFAFVSLLS